jgi:hypothetical protein
MLAHQFSLVFKNYLDHSKFGSKFTKLRKTVDSSLEKRLVHIKNGAIRAKKICSLNLWIFIFNENDSLGFWMLLYDVYSGESQSVCPIKVWIQINMLYLGSVLHWEVKTVAYFKHWGLLLVRGTFIRNKYDLQGSIVFLINGDARLGSDLLKYGIFRGESQSVCL